MTAFELVVIVLSVVISLAFTHLLTGIARLIQARKVKFSIIHAAWIGQMLFTCVDYWLSLWAVRETEVWSLAYLSFWLAVATSIYLAGWLIIPATSDIEDGIDLQVYHRDNRRRYLGAYVFYYLLGGAINLTIPGMESAALLVLGFLVALAAAWLWPDRRVQLAAVIANYAMLTWYCLRYIAVL